MAQHDEALANIIGMGFEDWEGKEALTMSNGNLEQALELLLTRPANFKPVKPKPQFVEPKHPEFRPEKYKPVEPAPVQEKDKKAKKKKKKLAASDDNAFGMSLIDDDMASAVSANLLRNTTVTILAEDDISETIGQEINRIAGICDVTFSQAGLLLRYFQWNSEKLLEQFFDDPDRVKDKAGIPKQKKKANILKMTECLICAEDLNPKHATGLDCGHAFCNVCWASYLKIQISEGNSIGITCMATKCKVTVPEDIVKGLLPPDSYKKYTSFLTKSFVEDNPNIKWCPAPGCGNAVKSELKAEKTIRCSCGFKFCFQCAQESHAPCSCQQLVAWKKKCADDSETYNWIKVNTQECPQCHSSIEKNGGCNHMTCRKCKHEFCWICGGNWRGHTSCNRYDDKKDGEHKGALERYLHYYHRYMVHENSKKHETGLRTKALDKQMELQAKNQYRLVDTSHIDNCVEALIECRRTLKYTYVFAYYLPEGSCEKNLFEYLQEDLEKSTENLSGLLEAPTSDDLEVRRTIMDATFLAQKRLDHLLDGVEEGLTEGAQMGANNKGDKTSVSAVKPANNNAKITTPAKPAAKGSSGLFGLRRK